METKSIKNDYFCRNKLYTCATRSSEVETVASNYFPLIIDESRVRISALGRVRARFHLCCRINWWKLCNENCKLKHVQLDQTLYARMRVKTKYLFMLSDCLIVSFLLSIHGLIDIVSSNKSAFRIYFIQSIITALVSTKCEIISALMMLWRIFSGLTSDVIGQRYSTIFCRGRYWEVWKSLRSAWNLTELFSSAIGLLVVMTSKKLNSPVCLPDPNNLFIDTITDKVRGPNTALQRFANYRIQAICVVTICVQTSLSRAYIS